MNKTTRLNAPLALTLLLTLAMGCSTTQPERSQRAVSDLQQLTKLLTESDTQIAALNKELRAVSKAKPDDLRDAYADFDKELQRTQQLAGEVNDLSDDLKNNAEKYFETWEKQASKLNNSDLKDMSLERQKTLRQEFDRVMAAMDRLAAAYKSYSTDVKDLQMFLGNDMTRAGSEMAKPQITKVLAGGDPLQAALRGAQTEVQSMATILKPK